MKLKPSDIRSRLRSARESNSPIRELAELRGEVLAEARAVLGTADDEGRAMNDDERRDHEQFTELLREISDAQHAYSEQLDADRRAAVDFDRRQRGGDAATDESWIAADGSPIEVLRPEQRMSGPTMPDEYRDVTFGRFVRAMVLGAKTEAERRALAEGADSTGGATVPAPLAAHLIDALRAKTQCIRAGARTVKMTSDTLSIARLEGDPSGTWHAENVADFSESTPSFARLKFTAYTLIALVRISRELLADSLNIEAGLKNAFAKSLAISVDKAALIGTGSGEPKGIANWANVGSVDMGTNGAALTDYDPVLDAANVMMTANAGEPTAAIMHPRTLTAFNKLKDSQNRSLERPPAIKKLPFLPTTTVPIDDTHGTANDASRVFVGDYSGLMIGMRQQVRIDTLREYYAINHQYGFIASLRCDVVLEHDEQFAIIEGVTP